MKKEEEVKDKLIVCEHCGSPLCYEQHIGGFNVTWLCIKCGYTTSTVLTEGSEIYNKTMETSPELYKTLVFIGPSKRVWMPATVIVPDLGMVFVDGDSEENWEWAGVKAIELTTEEKASKRYAKDQTHKMDMKNIRRFGKEGFLEAFEHAGFLPEIQ